MEFQGTSYKGSARSPLVFEDRSLAVKANGGNFHEAVMRGRCFCVASQAGVTSQAGLSATTPVLTLYNPAGSGTNLILWHAAAQFEVAFVAAASVWLAAGTNTVAAAVTGTLTAAHRNLKLGLSQSPVARTFTVATLPAAPVAIDLLGVGLTGAITTAAALAPLAKWYNGSVILTPGTNLTIQTSTASGASGMLCSFIWEEVDA